MKFSNLIPAVIILLFLFACNEGNNDASVDADFIIPDSVLNENPVDFSQEALNDVIDNIASPVEMATIIRNAKADFSRKNLCSTDLIDNYTSGEQKALALGVFGADLGYINVYSKNSLVIDYITAIKSLADDIKVGQFFEFETLKRLAKNSENIDSLTYLSVHSFNEIDSYLRESGRGNLSTLIIAGAWIEGLFLATQIIKERPNKEIAEKIGEQKLILNNILLILGNYNDDEFFAELIASLGGLKTELDQVIITYEKGEPTSVEEDGRLIIVQNETSIINISEEQISRIVAATETARNLLVNRKK
ncbi:MAG: hypothetical protein ABIJ16_06405 [Bacteroidota bacterium]